MKWTKTRSGLCAIGITLAAVISLILIGLISTSMQTNDGETDMALIEREYEEALAYDRSTKITYVNYKPPSDPVCPGAAYEAQYIPDDYVEAFGPGSGYVPFSALDLPFRIGQQATNGGIFSSGTTISTSYLEKFGSVPALIGFYANFNFATQPKDDPDNTLFLQNFPNRGPSNLKKRQYMSAMTSDKFPLYASKIQILCDRLEYETVVEGKPFLSTLRRLLIEFTLDLHVGENAHPVEVIEYFTNFSDILGYISNTNVDLKPMWIRGRVILPIVEKYFSDRIDAVIASNDQSTLIYHWLKSGMTRNAAIRETIHNAVATNQIENGIYRAMVTSEWSYGTPSDAAEFWFPTPVMPPPLSVDFFSKFQMALNNPQEQLNVVREIYRLMAPNGNAFSKLSVEGDAEHHVQVRTIWAELMASSHGTGNPQLDGQIHFTYNTSIYSAFQTDIDSFVELAPNASLDDQFQFSSIGNDPNYNNGVVIQNANPLVQAVFPTNRDASFGIGHRRCPGQPLAYKITIELMKRLVHYNREFRPVSASHMCNPTVIDLVNLIPIAPRTAPYNNLFLSAVSP